MIPAADRSSSDERVRLFAWPLGVSGYALLLLIAVIWGIPHMENDLERTSQRALEGRGVVGLDVEFDGRVGLISGGDVATSGRADVEEIVSRVNGVRRIEVQTPEPTVAIAVVTPTTTAAPTSTTSEAPVERGIESSLISFKRDVDDHAVLLGRVATAEQRDELFAAADGAGFSRISDRIVVSDDVAIDEDRHTAVLNLLTVVSVNVLPASLSLEDAVLSLSGESGQPDVAADLADPVETLRQLGIETTIDVVQMDEDEQVVRLGEELAQILSLAARIEPERSNFDAESSNLDVQDEVVLQRVGQAMRRFPLPEVEIIGHTDGVGPEDENLVLSRLRAQSVFDFLVGGQGVERTRLSTDGRGEQEPIASNDTEEGRRMNRRVQFVVKKKGA